MDRVLLWDFDGTLGGRIDGLFGRAWSASMLEAVRAMMPETKLTQEDIAPHLGSGFPWHQPDVAHPELNDPETWWAHIRGIYRDIYGKLGFTTQQSEELAWAAQRRYVDLSVWELYADTLPVLGRLKQAGWRHVIVSNHVPELRTIVRHLGLEELLEDVINSAEVGYEKPNPAIFRIALDRIGAFSEVWMIGDNIKADVLGAEAAGIPGILVRNSDERAKLRFANLLELEAYLQAGK